MASGLRWVTAVVLAMSSLGAMGCGDDNNTATDAGGDGEDIVLDELRLNSNDIRS